MRSGRPRISCIYGFTPRGALAIAHAGRARFGLSNVNHAMQSCVAGLHSSAIPDINIVTLDIASTAQKTVARRRCPAANPGTRCCAIQYCAAPPLLDCLAQAEHAVLVRSSIRRPMSAFARSLTLRRLRPRMRAAMRLWRNPHEQRYQTLCGLPLTLLLRTVSRAAGRLRSSM